MKRVMFWQTFGGSVEVPDDQVDAFIAAVENNSVDEFPKVMETFDPSWYEGEVVEAQNAR